MSENFNALGDPGWASPGQVSVPQQTWDKTSLRNERYVRLTRSDNQAENVFKVMPREGAAGDVVWVSPGQLGLAAKEVVAVVIEAADKNAYHWMQLVGTEWGRLTLAGLALGLIGIGIDAAFDIGKYQLLFPTSDTVAAWARVVAYVLKALGLLIVFLQATWFRKD